MHSQVHRRIYLSLYNIIYNIYIYNMPPGNAFIINHQKWYLGLCPGYFHWLNQTLHTQQPVAG